MRHNYDKLTRFFVSGRGFDQETFSEKDEGAVCHYNLGGVESEKAVGGLKPEWDLDHPSMPHPRSNAAILLLGEQKNCLVGSGNTGFDIIRTQPGDLVRIRGSEGSI